MTMKPHETSEINIFTMENSQLQPQSVFHYFSIINQIPRPSGKEEQMMAYLHKFVKEHGLEQISDAGLVESTVASILAANASQVEEYRGGKRIFRR